MLYSVADLQVVAAEQDRVVQRPISPRAAQKKSSSAYAHRTARAESAVLRRLRPRSGNAIFNN
jgi:hypothetical protein